MRLFGKRKPKDRRMPENHALRQQVDSAQKLETQQSLAAGQSLTSQTSERIERLRNVALVVGARTRNTKGIQQ